MDKKIALSIITLLGIIVLISASFVVSVDGSNWDITITATNQLEPMKFGLHNNATEDYDVQFDSYISTPQQDKVIMDLDGTYATSIKSLSYPKNWTLKVGVTIGQ